MLLVRVMHLKKMQFLPLSNLKSRLVRLVIWRSKLGLLKVGVLEATGGILAMATKEPIFASNLNGINFI